MADTDAEIVIGITLDDGSVRQATVQADDLAKALGDTMGKSVSKGVDRSLTGLITQFRFVADVASKAFSAVSGVFESAVQEATQAEAAVTKFNVTLANSGKFTQEASDRFLEFANSLQRVGTVSDDAVVAAASSLVSIGKLSGDALEQATQASVDLAAGLGTDLGTAFDLVAKASAGNTAALSRYGLKIDESIPKSERFANLLDQINQKFGGIDVAKANTFGGAIAQFQNNLSDLLENLGKLITNSPALIAAIRFISEGLGNVAARIGAFGKQGDVLRPIISGVLAFAKVISENVLPVMELLYNFSNFVFKAILTGITALGAGFSGVTNLIVQGLSKVGIVSDETAAGFAANFEANKSTMESFALATGEAFTNIASNFTFTEATNNFITDLTTAVETAEPLLQRLKNSTVQAGADLVNTFALTAKQLAQIVNNGIVNGISQGVQTIVTNLAKGKNAFQGLLKTIGSIFGDMLIQIGTTVLLAGVGMEAIRASIVGLTGGPAIFAGIALIAAGALLKALSGGGGGDVQTTQPVGAGGVPGSPDVSGGIGGERPELDRNRETQVAINIQGNVLDRKETGLEIATVLQEYFDTSDGVLARS